jgi:hypothetical protein
MAAIRCLSLGPVDGISAEYPVEIVRGVASNLKSIKREAIEIVRGYRVGRVAICLEWPGRSSKSGKGESGHALTG